MDNVCVACGAELPTEYGSMICKQCESSLFNSIVLCPSCGSHLEIIQKSTYNTSDGFGYSTLFHCSRCRSDWEREEEYLAKPVKFRRKYWG